MDWAEDYGYDDDYDWMFEWWIFPDQYEETLEEAA